MRILQLCKKFPYPLKDGESLAVSYLAKALSELGCSVTLLAMNTHKHWYDFRSDEAPLSHYKAVHTVPVDNRLKPVEAFKNLFSRESYHIQRFIDPAFEAKLKAILQQERFDVVQLETLYLAPYIPVIRKYSNAAVVLRAHNVEHEIWERVAANSNPVKSWYLNRITPRLKQFETDTLNDYDLVAAISARDLARFTAMGLEKPGIVTPIGLDARDYRPDNSGFQRPLSLAFIGSLDWMPNVEGLQWFLKTVWGPVLQPRFPELEFHIAGRNTPKWLLKMQMPGVQVHGEVPDASAFINAHSVLVVPLLSGGGMRVKILEGMALGKVILSTPMGMEGIDARHKKEALLAERPRDFLRAVQFCYQEGPKLAEIGKNAQEMFASQYDNLEIARRLLSQYKRFVPVQPVTV